MWLLHVPPAICLAELKNNSHQGANHIVSFSEKNANFPVSNMLMNAGQSISMAKLHVYVRTYYSLFLDKAFNFM